MEPLSVVKDLDVFEDGEAGVLHALVAVMDQPAMVAAAPDQGLAQRRFGQARIQARGHGQAEPAASAVGAAPSPNSGRMGCRIRWPGQFIVRVAEGHRR